MNLLFEVDVTHTKKKDSTKCKDDGPLQTKKEKSA